MQKLTRVVAAQIQVSVKEALQKMNALQMLLQNLPPLHQMRRQVEARESQARPFNVHGFPQDPKKSRNENFVPKNEKLIEVLHCLGVNPKIEQLRRLENFDKYRRKP